MYVFLMIVFILFLFILTDYLRYRFYLWEVFRSMEHIKDTMSEQLNCLDDKSSRGFEVLLCDLVSTYGTNRISNVKVYWISKECIYMTFKLNSRIYGETKQRFRISQK